jgi:DNA-binding response OmpR family regulator
VVLVVEDDPDMATLIARCLVGAGYRTAWADDGTSALALAQRHTVAMVLLDWRIKGDLGGTSLVQRLRGACPYWLPVVVISGDSDALTEARGAGVEDYLPKPFQVEDLVHVVDEYCR